MGRKTNSVSLRLKKTNRDYNNCWYGDILYAENFSKSLKVGNYLSQTLKTIGMPCPQASVIGAYKKASLLVCYLDPKKRKRLLEKSSKGLARATQALQAYQSKQSEKKTKAFFSLGQIKQDSKALLKPLQAILETSFAKPLSSENPRDRALHLYATPSFAVESDSKPSKKVDTTHKRPPIVTDQNDFIVKNKETTRLANLYRGSLGLELNQSKGFSESMQSKGESLVYFSKTDCKTLSSVSFEGTFFVKKNTRAFSKALDPLEFLPLSLGLPSLGLPEREREQHKDLKHKGSNNTTFVEKKLSKSGISFLKPRKHFSFERGSEKANQRNSAALQFFPYVFYGTSGATQREKTSSRFEIFYDFFYSDKKHTPLICAFSKNLTIFGKKTDLCYTISNNSFSYLSELVLNNPSCTENYIKNVLVDKQQLYPKGENCSLTSLYGFYNGFSRFWGNVVSLCLYKSTNETSCALFLADTVSYLLERKILFRSIKRQLLLELNQSKYAFVVPELPKLWGSPFPRAFENKKKVTGIRISCSGRVGGRSKKAQRSRKDTFMWGETGLHVFSSKLDFAKTHAETPFGVVGVQVWVCTK